MEQSLPVWLIPALTLVGGIVIGVILARVLQRTAPGKTQHQLDELQERFDSYQSEVVTHFNTTASLVKKLTQNYHDVQEHLSNGAERLALDEVSRERLLASLVDDSRPRERKPQHCYMALYLANTIFLVATSHRKHIWRFVTCSTIFRLQ